MRPQLLPGCQRRWPEGRRSRSCSRLMQGAALRGRVERPSCELPGSQSEQIQGEEPRRRRSRGQRRGGASGCGCGGGGAPVAAGVPEPEVEELPPPIAGGSAARAGQARLTKRSSRGEAAQTPAAAPTAAAGAHQLLPVPQRRGPEGRRREKRTAMKKSRARTKKPPVEAPPACQPAGSDVPPPTQPQPPAPPAASCTAGTCCRALSGRTAPRRCRSASGP